MYEIKKSLISSRLKQIHMSQQELAIRLGVSKSTVSMYVNTHTIMNLDVARNIAYILSCDIYDLYEWEFIDT